MPYRGSALQGQCLTWVASRTEVRKQYGSTRKDTKPVLIVPLYEYSWPLFWHFAYIVISDVTAAANELRGSSSMFDAPIPTAMIGAVCTV